MDWKKRIPGCFGSADCRLAGHACDLKRAAELLNECLDLQDGISYHELESALVDYMKSKGANSQHIERELNRARELFGSWLV